MKPGDESFSLASILFHFEGIEGIALEMFRAFLPSAPERLAQIEAALEARNAPALRIAAHSLRGSLSYFHHAPSVQAAKAVEEAAEEENFPLAQTALADLRGQVEALVGLLSTALEEKMP